ncbi:hypothetical protein [Sphingobacterium lumbrici]|uniref:hypothetical protein n=1 Tax=Sphingobacterium lumbrici TaxID=2559600 RepID=UPI0015E3AB2D|nr:hypothetical protein [Sphingobacterium lumbrici]
MQLIQLFKQLNSYSILTRPKKEKNFCGLLPWGWPDLDLYLSADRPPKYLPYPHKKREE